MRRQIIAAVATLSFALPVHADGSIGLYFDSGAINCEMDILCNCRGTAYVYAGLFGAIAGGITGVEYKIATGPDSNADPGWVFTETFVPGSIVVGSGIAPPDPSPRGVQVAWVTCQPGDGFKVLIGTVRIFRTDCGSAPELRLRVIRHDQSSNPSLQCPLVTICDAPNYTAVCVAGAESRVNNAGVPCCLSCTPPAADCTVAAELESWSRVKALYRD